MTKKAKLAASAAISPLLLTIVGFGATGGYAAKGDELNALVTAGQVETGPDGENGTVAVRATAAGVAAATPPAGAPATSGEPAAAKPSFNVVMNVPLPETNRGGNKGKSIYPFEGMTIGASFFIPATAETPEPWKSLASTATSATRRYDETVMENGAPVMEDHKVPAKAAKGTPGQPDYVAATVETMVRREKKKHTRIFTMREIADGAPWGHPGVKGAGVFRTQ